MFNKDGKVIIPSKSDGRPLIKQLALPVQRRKGAIGDVVVTWSVASNHSVDGAISPVSGNLQMKVGQWNSEIILLVDQEDEASADRVLYVKLRNTTGGAILASPNLTEAEIIIKGDRRSSTFWWKVGGAVTGVVFFFIIIGISCTARRLRNSNKKKK